MATSKKIKPVSNEFNNVGDSKKAPTGSKATVLEILEAEKPMTSADFSDEVKTKLESIEKVENANAELSREKSELESMIAEYVEEIASLKDQLKKQKQPEKIIEKAVKVPDEVALRAEVEALRAEVETLRAENDRAQIKISELTFENAKMMS